MNSFRKVVGFLMAAVTLAAFALPANAQTIKTFNIAPPSSLPVGTQTISVTFNNTGNSNFNSIELDATSSSLSFNTTPAPTWTAGFTGQVSIINGTTLQIVNLSPSVKKSITVTLSVNTTGTGTCGQSIATWYAHAWTGSPSSPSQTFALSPLPTNTTIDPVCTLKFAPQPANAEETKFITSVPSDPTGAAVGVGLYNGTALDTSFTGPVTLAIKSGTGTSGATLTGGGPVSAISGIATFPNLSIDKIGTGYVLTASSSPYASVDSNAITIFDVGAVGCTTSDGNFAGNGSYDPDADNAYTGSRGYGLRRGKNKDAADCTKVDLTFTNDGTKAFFTFDKSTGQKGSFRYVMVFDPVATDPTPTTGYGSSTAPYSTAGWSQKRPYVSWGTVAHDPPLSGTSDFVPALACFDDPDPTAMETMTPAQLQALLPTIPDVYPFHGNSFSQYQPGQLAKACVSQIGWTATGGKVQYWFKVIDQEDTAWNSDP